MKKTDFKRMKKMSDDELLGYAGGKEHSTTRHAALHILAKRQNRWWRLTSTCAAVIAAVATCGILVTKVIALIRSCSS